MISVHRGASALVQAALFCEWQVRAVGVLYSFRQIFPRFFREISVGFFRELTVRPISFSPSHSQCLIIALMTRVHRFVLPSRYSSGYLVK